MLVISWICLQHVYKALYLLVYVIKSTAGIITYTSYSSLVRDYILWWLTCSWTAYTSSDKCHLYMCTINGSWYIYIYVCVYTVQPVTSQSSLTKLNSEPFQACMQEHMIYLLYIVNGKLESLYGIAYHSMDYIDKWFIESKHHTKVLQKCTIDLEWNPGPFWDILAFALRKTFVATTRTILHIYMNCGSLLYICGLLKWQLYFDLRYTSSQCFNPQLYIDIILYLLYMDFTSVQFYIIITILDNTHPPSDTW